ncbi:hypothetical protein ACL1BL_11625, partial [Corynebacterium striatum]
GQRPPPKSTRTKTQTRGAAAGAPAPVPTTRNPAVPGLRNTGTQNPHLTCVDGVGSDERSGLLEVG